ncbi:hypothetical protein [Ruminococcus flavefaciens]|uniref:hypothetical protein n=1 Tax=Ruminococcus flavefaciens TaxID=1265 RepID=UPI0026EBD878|nr:hypothetical protein [Ruminococcus flavefaciens]
MNKVEKVLIGVFGLGICVYLAHCIKRGMIYGFSGELLSYFTYPIFSEYGLILALSVIGLITVFIVHAILKRKKRKAVGITRADKIWFAVSFLPITLDVLYGLYGAIAGIDFLWSKCYGFEGFILAAVFGGILIIPVLPLCIIWQIIYLTGRHKAKKAEKELSL